MFKRHKIPHTQSLVTGTSPLNQIQQAEAEAARRVAAARETARQVESDAQAQTASILHEAQVEGQREGQAEYEKIIAQTNLESQQMLSEALQRAESLRRRGESYLETALRQAVAIVAGMNRETETS